MCAAGGNCPTFTATPGSRGIVVLAVLQSWARAEGCWGEQGMRKLWDASNVKIFAGGGSATCASSKAFPS